MEGSVVLKESGKHYEVLQGISIQTEEDPMSCLISCLEIMTDKGYKEVRKSARVRAKSAIGRMGAETRENAVRYMTSLLGNTDDHCLQNYVADILLSMCNPDVDTKLYWTIESASGRVAPFVRDFVVGRLGKDKLRVG
jgi:hypothetical protein